MARYRGPHRDKFLLTKVLKGLNYCLMEQGRGLFCVPFSLVILLIVAGCASQNLRQEQGADLERRIVELKRVQADGKVRLEELSNKLLLLQERVEEDRRVVDTLKERGLPLTAPKDLKVVKLTEAALEGEEGRKEKERKTKKAERREVSMGGRYEPEDVYRRAQDLFWSGKLDEAVDVFRRFFDEYPKHHLADNALYWTGEAFYSQANYDQALEEFRGLIEHYPEGNKAPDALLKIAYSYRELDKASDADEAFKELVDAYPGSEPAQKARKAIEELYMNRRGEQ